MVFKAKKRRKILSLAREFKEAFILEAKKIRQFEWDKTQFQFPPQFRLVKGVRARNFGFKEDAEKFKRVARKEGFRSFFVHKEIVEFFGAVCVKPQIVFMVYFSKKEKLPRLKVDDPFRISLAKSNLLSPTPSVCLPREFDADFSVIAGATSRP